MEEFKELAEANEWNKAKLVVKAHEPWVAFKLGL